MGIVLIVVVFVISADDRLDGEAVSVPVPPKIALGQSLEIWGKNFSLSLKIADA